MDQAAPADQSILRPQRERREDPDLDSGVRLCARRDCAEALGVGGKPLPDSTDSQHHAFRKSAHFTGLPST